jgi:hypothetical protein
MYQLRFFFFFFFFMLVTILFQYASGTGFERILSERPQGIIQYDVSVCSPRAPALRFRYTRYTAALDVPKSDNAKSQGANVLYNRSQVTSFWKTTAACPDSYDVHSMVYYIQKA